MVVAKKRLARFLPPVVGDGVAATLLKVAANPEHLGADIGFLCVLHTWGQTLPKQILSGVFRGKFTDGLKCLFRRKNLAFHGSLQWLQEPRAFARFLHGLHQHNWVVYIKKPFGGPEHVLHYLARYTHRVAISNHRLLGMENGKVTFRWKDYAHGGKQRKMTLACEEFIRRFLLHVLPKGFVRIRHYGWMATATGGRGPHCAGPCSARRQRHQRRRHHPTLHPAGDVPSAAGSWRSSR